MSKFIQTINLKKANVQNVEHLHARRRRRPRHIVDAERHRLNDSVDQGRRGNAREGAREAGRVGRGRVPLVVAVQVARLRVEKKCEEREIAQRTDRISK
jgi:hypothetical protein